MMWTLSDSMDHEVRDTEGSEVAKEQEKSKKKESIFHRSHAEKMEYLRKAYHETDERKDKTSRKPSQSKDKNECDAQERNQQ